ncbi:MAG: glycoside hydrolase family 104 protein [Hydrogenophaga sp.]|uniref:glycoside hydrolase family 24 protein n=1 Tax=Hydrogenophaga sp. TaxID=1904254 RepID=UPI002ABB6EF7|nr:glycoside hydrolase family 104 protein [Hydrogenophaga sp.]MDZ4102034.1 glycoside hydrolase family 104 protein [Hydrogenophaga sp.]
MTRVQRLAIFLLLLGGGAAAYAGTRRPAAAPGAPADAGQGGGFDWPALDAWTWLPGGTPASPGAPIDWTQANATETAQKDAAMNPTDPDRNVRALLDAIAYAEGTANRPDPYRVCYAYSHTIQSFADHPFTLGEWPGVVLTDTQCRGAGLGPGCKSTAAGKYQITVTTWRPIKSQLKLPDFSPASQDLAAIELLRQVGALDLIRRGDLAGALSAARRTWASLPGANYAGQGMRTSAQMLTAYLDAGGSLA